METYNTKQVYQVKDVEQKEKAIMSPRSLRISSKYY